MKVYGLSLARANNYPQRLSSSSWAMIIWLVLPPSSLGCGAVGIWLVLSPWPSLGSGLVGVLEGMVTPSMRAGVVGALETVVVSPRSCMHREERLFWSLDDRTEPRDQDCDMNSTTP